MSDWFTVEQIDNSTYAISEYKHWEETHCYLLLGAERAVLIDTGLGVENIREAVERITSLPVMAVTTHVHWDHIGGHRYFKNSIAVYEKERDWIAEKFPIPLQVVKQNLTCKPCNFPEGFRVEDYTIFQGEPARLLSDGDCISLGGRELIVIHTPGHSPGHCCFYEPARKYLYSGDLVYRGCLDAFYPTTDPQMFFHSIQKIRDLEVIKVLPGHHQLHIPVDLIGRIENGFHQLEEIGKLKQGNGIFSFEDFQIHI